MNVLKYLWIFMKNKILMLTELSIILFLGSTSMHVSILIIPIINYRTY